MGSTAQLCSQMLSLYYLYAIVYKNGMKDDFSWHQHISDSISYHNCKTNQLSLWESLGVQKSGGNPPNDAGVGRRRWGGRALHTEINQILQNITATLW